MAKRNKPLDEKLVKTILLKYEPRYTEAAVILKSAPSTLCNFARRIGIDDAVKAKRAEWFKDRDQKITDAVKELKSKSMVARLFGVTVGVVNGVCYQPGETKKLVTELTPEQEGRICGSYERLKNATLVAKELEIPYNSVRAVLTSRGHALERGSGKMTDEDFVKRYEDLLTDLIEAGSLTPVAVKYGLTRERIRQIGVRAGVWPGAKRGAREADVANKKRRRSRRREKVTEKVARAKSVLLRTRSYIAAAEELGMKAQDLRNFASRNGISLYKILPDKKKDGALPMSASEFRDKYEDILTVYESTECITETARATGHKYNYVHSVIQRYKKKTA